MVDSNILFSALIKDAITRTLLFKINNTLVSPEIIFKEAMSYKSFLIKKSGLKANNFNALFASLIQCIEIIPLSKLLPHVRRANRIMESIDKKDAIFLACAYAIPHSVIWSDDKDFQKQDSIPVITTDQLLSYFHEFSQYE